MSSQSEDESGVHPMVSNLLGQKFVPRAAGEVFKYTREEMIRMSQLPLSTDRPDYLSTDFDGDDGKFSPFKWLEYKWEVEGIKNKAPMKKLQELREGEDNAGLSPQRRGFSGGCRAPPSEDKRDKDGGSKDEGWSTVDSRNENRDRLGSSGTSKWRNGAGGFGEKYSSNSKSNDFKLPFQKNGNERSNRSGGWKTVDGKEKQGGAFSSTGKFIPARNYRNDDRGERVPEWADGTTTMDDMIELRGFEEPSKKKKGGKKDKGDNERKEKKEAKQSSRPSSRENPSSTNPQMPTKLPTTDAEFAAILGLDTTPDVPLLDNASIPSGSRLSKFFQRNSDHGNTDHRGGSGHHSHQRSEETASIIGKIFGKTPSSGGQTPNAMQNQGYLAHGMRLEDLERDIRTDRNTDSAHKGNPLQDPAQQAQLLSKLHSMAKQRIQEENFNGANPNPAGPGNVNPFGNFPQQGPGINPLMNPLSHPVVRAQLQQAYNAQMQQAIAQSVAQGGDAHPHPQLAERIRANVIANFVAHQRQAMAALVHHHHQQQQQQAAQQHQPQPQQQPQQPQQQPQLPPQSHPQQAQSAKPSRAAHPARMIPASVQRQMNKNISSATDERKEREIDDGVDRAQSDAFKKLAMQQQYNALMNAMQTGLPMAAWRNPASNPQSLQMQAQAHAAQAQAQAQYVKQEQLRLLIQSQQAQMKLLHMNHTQQHSAGHHHERQPPFQMPNQAQMNGHNAQSELSQVGPIQTPLEKILAAAGVPAAHFTGSSDSQTNRSSNLNSQHVNNPHGIPTNAQPISLEELERQLTETK